MGKRVCYERTRWFQYAKEITAGKERINYDGFIQKMTKKYRTVLFNRGRATQCLKRLGFEPAEQGIWERT